MRFPWGALCPVFWHAMTLRDPSRLCMWPVMNETSMSYRQYHCHRRHVLGRQVKGVQLHYCALVVPTS
jgi:hypothetical protein